jgi:hypothetical protein
MIKTVKRVKHFQITKWFEDGTEYLKAKFPDFCEHIRRKVTPEAGEVLDELTKQYIIVGKLRAELETYAYGNAYCKITGLPWEHRIKHTVEILEELDEIE